MVKEELTVHEVEREVMECPCDEEEARVIPEPITDGYIICQTMGGDGGGFWTYYTELGRFLGDVRGGLQR